MTLFMLNNIKRLSFDINNHLKCKGIFPLISYRFYSSFNDNVTCSPNEVITNHVDNLYSINSYHDYIYQRVIDHNGINRSWIQKILPVDHINDGLILIHDYLNLSWCSTITLCTLLLKIIMLPLWLSAERARRMNAHLVPEAMELKEKAKLAYDTGNVKLASEIQERIYKTMNKTVFIKGAIIQIITTITQGIMFATVYGGLRLFAIKPKENPNFTFESPLWLDSLSLPDPYYIFPSIFGILMTIVYEHNAEISKGLMDKNIQKQQKYIKIFPD